MPRVSVIIPSYNVSDSLEVAVRSVMRQTEQDLEIVIVDDCSTDETLRIAQQLALEDSRIRVIAIPQNGGKVVVMNTAMKEVSGTWIALLDADDWYAVGRIKSLIDAAEAAKVDMVADDWVSVDGPARMFMTSPLPKASHDIVLDLDSYLRASRPMAKADYGMLKPIVRRDFIERTGVSYHPRARRGQDFYFLLSCFIAGGRLLLLKKPYYYYVEPYGVISRQWAQAGRTNYNFGIMIEVNEDFIQNFGPRFTRLQLNKLRIRTRGWQGIIVYHTMRAALAEKQYARAARLTATAPRGFWYFLATRISSRLRGKLIGPSQRILGPAEIGAEVPAECLAQQGEAVA